MTPKDQKKLFDELYDLYQNTKTSSERFTFWTTNKSGPALFNQGTDYLNIGIVQITSKSHLQLAGFHFAPDSFNTVKLRVENRHDDIPTLINKARKIGQKLIKPQVQSFLDDISKVAWTYTTSVIDGNLIKELKNIYENFFKDIQDYDTANGTCFYKILKIAPKTCDNKIKQANEKIKDWISKGIIGKQTKDNNHPLNLILYGPPGTGKTYNTLFKALERIEGTKEDDLVKELKAQDAMKKNAPDPDKVKSGYELLKERYDNYVEAKLIRFTTFHQSMSYEDFIEGIKPIPDKDDIEAIHKNDSKSKSTLFGDGTTLIKSLSRMKYEVKPGIFKQICDEAGKSGVITHKLVLNDVIDYFCFDFEKTRKVIECTKSGSTFKVNLIKTKKDGTYDTIGLINNNNTSQTIKLDVVRANYGNYKSGTISDHTLIKPSRSSKSSTYGNSELCFGLLEKIKDFEDNIYPQYISGALNTGITKNQNYVLIIDEINRGNVAQIFGELITLIEPSKRLGNNEEMKAILPYSSAKEGTPVYFGVPNNLYIIGTMNTADRSVEALDTALRRRFSFEEMMPDKKLLEGKTVCNVGLDELLEIINKRIVALKDREHQIGHSYFMGCNTEDDLKNVFKDKIIPLLQEYFYGDYKKIYYVLGPGFVEDSYAGKKEDSIRKELFPFVGDRDEDLDIPEERYEIRPFDDKSDNKVVIKAAVHELINSNNYQKWEKDHKENHKGNTFKKENGEEIDRKYVAEREFGGEDISIFPEEQAQNEHETPSNPGE